MAADLSCLFLWKHIPLIVPKVLTSSCRNQPSFCCHHNTYSCTSSAVLMGGGIRPAAASLRSLVRKLKVAHAFGCNTAEMKNKEVNTGSSVLKGYSTYFADLSYIDGNVGASFCKWRKSVISCSGAPLLIISFKTAWQCYRKTMQTSGLFFHTYPQCNLSTEWHHWRQFIRLHAASSGATEGFMLLFSHVQ